MSETNKLSFLSGQLDAKKSELSSLIGKKKEEPKAEPKVEIPAHIRVKAEIEALDRKTLPEREAYAENALKMIEECEENVQKAGAVYEALTELPEVMLHLDTGSVVVQLTTALPKALDRMGMKILKQDSGSMSLTSLLMSGSFYAVFLVREVLCGGKESLSIAIVGEANI